MSEYTTLFLSEQVSYSIINLKDKNLFEAIFNCIYLNYFNIKTVTINTIILYIRSEESYFYKYY